MCESSLLTLTYLCSKRGKVFDVVWLVFLCPFFLERLKSTSTSAVTGTIVFVIKENMIFRTHARSKQFTVLFFH